MNKTPKSINRSCNIVIRINATKDLSQLAVVEGTVSTGHILLRMMAKIVIETGYRIDIKYRSSAEFADTP